MEENLKQLLLKDICARLSYGVEISLTDGTSGMITSIKIVPHGTFVTVYFNRDNVEDVSLEYIKPYLRSISSMTEEEKKSYHIIKDRLCEACIHGTIKDIAYWTNSLDLWFYKYHFDNANLIEKGLALEAKEGMYD